MEDQSVLMTRYINEQGEVNINLIPQEDKSKYMELSKSVKPGDYSSIMNYGKSISTAMQAYSDELLKSNLLSNTGKEISESISDLIIQLNSIDIDGMVYPSKLKQFIRKIPGLRKIGNSATKLSLKYKSVEDSIDKITDKLTGLKLMALRDANTLQLQLNQNIKYVNELGDLIIAGKLYSKELEDKIQSESEGSSYNQLDLKEFKNSFDKHLTDLTMLRGAFIQSLFQLRLIQRSNILDASNTDVQINLSIPLWKSQLSMTIALYNQRKSIEVKQKLHDTVNGQLVKNSELIKTQAVEIEKQNMKTVLDVESLKVSTQNLIETLKQIKAERESGLKTCMQAEAELGSLMTYINENIKFQPIQQQLLTRSES